MAVHRGHEEKENLLNKMAILLKTSRTQVDRLLDPGNDITLSSCSEQRRWSSAAF